MDLFTHMMIGYLISLGLGQMMGVSEPLLLFAVIMAIIPDLDILFFPLSYRFPVLSHRVGSHTFIFAFVGSLTGAGIASFVYGTPFIGMFIFGFVGGASHVLMDMLTNYAVPPFGPFAWRTYSLDLDGAINPIFLVFNLIMIPVMWNMRGRVSWDQYIIVVVSVALIHMFYFVMRGAQRFYMESKFRTEEGKVRAVATFSPLVWYIVRTVIIEKGIMLERYEKSHILGKMVPEIRFYVLDDIPTRIKAPVDTEEKAVAYSAIPVKDKLLYMERLRFMTAVVKEDDDGKAFDVFWFPWWERFQGPRGLLVRIFDDGRTMILGEQKRSIKGLS